jgi:hydroxymethylbilane synthase
MNELTIISRKSTLAKLQAIEVSDTIKKKFPEIKINFKTKDTSGDIDLTTPLHKMPEMGVFTSDIREDLLTENADIAVHSWKDLPVDLEEGTEIAATIKRADLRDVLIFKKSSFKKKRLQIFTSSPRRQENLSKFLKKAFPFEINSLSFVDIRGNILTRIQKLKDSNADGLVIAKAALDRLLSSAEKGLSELDSFKEDLDAFLWMVIPCSQNPCAPGQGALAIEVKSGNRKIIELLKEINDLDVFRNVEDEREKLKKYGGGCHQKIGVSIENHPLGKITTEKGLTPNKELINKRSFFPFKKEL